MLPLELSYTFPHKGKHSRTVKHSQPVVETHQTFPALIRRHFPQVFLQEDHPKSSSLAEHCKPQERKLDSALILKRVAAVLPGEWQTRSSLNNHSFTARNTSRPIMVPLELLGPFTSRPEVCSRGFGVPPLWDRALQLHVCQTRHGKPKMLMAQWASLHTACQRLPVQSLMPPSYTLSHSRCWERPLPA